MPFMELTLESLGDLDDGRVAKAFLAELRNIVRDCQDRPQDKKPRTLTLEAQIVPVVASEGGIVELDGVECEFKIVGRVPSRKSKTYTLRANNKGQVSFSCDNPTNPDQRTFFDGEGKQVSRTKPVEE